VQYINYFDKFKGGRPPSVHPLQDQEGKVPEQLLQGKRDPLKSLREGRVFNKFKGGGRPPSVHPLQDQEGKVPEQLLQGKRDPLKSLREGLQHAQVTGTPLAG